MSNLFNMNSRSKIKRNAFDLTHEKKLSCNMGDIVPIYLQEVVPGDKFRVSSEQLIRLAPMIAPMMQRVNVFTHFFWVPNRLVFDKWQDLITGGATGKVEPTFPQMLIKESTRAAWYPNLLGDYFGIPPLPVNSPMIPVPIEVNALPFRAYALIWNEYFRDQTLDAPIEFPMGETQTDQETINLTSLRRRRWEKDYFTSALPWAQRGDEVMIPTVPVQRTGSYPATKFYESDESISYAPGTKFMAGPVETVYDYGNGQTTNLVDSADKNHIAHIGASGPAGTESSGSIADLRKAARLQEWLERNARGGARYIEQIFAHFGVKSSDARLQRPEFLGGGMNPVVISEVLSTFSSENTPQGNMSGHGLSVGHDNQFTRFFEEHGYIIGVMSILPRTSYQQGIPRTFRKHDKFDFYFPEFAQIGEQPVFDQELYLDFVNGGANPDTVFGYQSRYAEYKFAPNTIHGDFRNSMAFWHMGRIFDTKPVLNDSFVSADPTHRVFAVTDDTEHKLYVQILNKVTAIRPMPVFGTPQL